MQTVIILLSISPTVLWVPEVWKKSSLFVSQLLPFVPTSPSLLIFPTVFPVSLLNASQMMKTNRKPKLQTWYRATCPATGLHTSSLTGLVFLCPRNLRHLQRRKKSFESLEKTKIFTPNLSMKQMHCLLGYVSATQLGNSKLENLTLCKNYMDLT